VRLRARGVVVICALLIASGAASTIQARAHDKAGLTSRTDPPLVLGYYVPYDPTSWVSLEARAEQLDVVAAQWVTIDGCGNLGSRDDQTLKRFARSHNLKVLPSLFTLSSALNHQLLTDEPTAATAVDNIVNYTLAEDYDGFDLDLENVDPDDRPALTVFVGALADALHEQGKILTLAIPAKDRDATVGWSGAYDYRALGALADLVTVMAYEYRGPFSGPGSVAPFAWVQRVTRFATAQMPPDRVLLGIAFYGYDWNTTSGSARSIGYGQFEALAERYSAPVSFDLEQQSLSFKYEGIAGEPPPSVPPQSRQNHAIAVHQPPPCDVQLPVVVPAAPTPRAASPDEPQLHQVWLEDSASAAARLSLADTYRVRGVSAWRLGLEDPAVWPRCEQWR
jgi:spore germination protein YaaH